MSQTNNRLLRDEILKTAVTRLSPKPEWAMIVTVDGLAWAAYEANSEIPKPSEDRIRAMSAAGLSLGERIADALNIGMLDECIICGNDGISIFTMMNEDWILTTNYISIKSFDDIHKQLQQTVVEMNKLLTHLRAP